MLATMSFRLELCLLGCASLGNTAQKWHGFGRMNKRHWIIKPKVHVSWLRNLESTLHMFCCVHRCMGMHPTDPVRMPPGIWTSPIGDSTVQTLDQDLTRFLWLKCQTWCFWIPAAQERRQDLHTALQMRTPWPS